MEDRNFVFTADDGTSVSDLTVECTAALFGNDRFFQDLALALHAFDDQVRITVDGKHVRGDHAVGLPASMRQLRDALDRHYVKDPHSRKRGCVEGR